MNMNMYIPEAPIEVQINDAPVEDNESSDDEDVAYVPVDNESNDDEDVEYVPVDDNGGKKSSDKSLVSDCQSNDEEFLSGLAKTIKELVPNAEHRNCAKHIYANWKKIHKGEEFKKLFWKAAYATNEAQFKKHSNAIKDIDSKAYDDFMKQDPTTFCKAFIRTWPKCDGVTSNLA
ncbi:hypothetical protein GH714_021147 [Hevea brasiliensis]|uniref:MULE transposase domain-containing protein n=1 Tax=Hevea brasiliensis TaxID=3981 RepID=A0A6A6LCT8_HEVBR|nr:hypothetical protein GH714_021147 [Hevea brasiliensis]